MVEGEEQNNAAEVIRESQHLNLEASVLGFFNAYCERHLNVHPASLSRDRNVKTGKLPELVSMGYQSNASYLRFKCDFLWTRSPVMRKCLPNDFKTRQCIGLLLPCTWWKVLA